jgi:hypothetical protein
MTDMSVALGQDMSSSAIQLGKALNDPIKGVSALQRVGVSFTASQKEQIKTLVQSGRTMDAQKLILDRAGPRVRWCRRCGGDPDGQAPRHHRQPRRADRHDPDPGRRRGCDRPRRRRAAGRVDARLRHGQGARPVYAGAAAALGLVVAFKAGRAAIESVSGVAKDVGAAMQWMGLRTAEAAVAEGAQATAAEGQVAANDAAAASATRLGTAMGVVAKAGVIVGLAAVKSQVDEAGASFTQAKTDSGSLDGALLHLGQTGEFTGSAIAVFKQGWGPFAQDVHTSGEAVARFGDLAKGAIGGANESFTEMIGRQIDGASRMGQLTAITEQYDASLSRLTQGGQGAAAKLSSIS